MELPSLQSNNSPSKMQMQEDQVKKYSIEVNNLFNKLIGYDYNSKFSENDELSEDITKFFDMLLWCEKKCPELIYQLFDMMALQQIQDLHLSKCVSTLFKGYILLLGNCKEGGLIAEQLLDYKLPHIFLQAYMGADKTAEQQEELIEYIGSYLKCYDRIFKAEWLHKFIISQDYFELLQICFKFFICPQPLTRTSVFNIVLDILNQKQVQQFIVNNKSRLSFYENIAEIMTKSLKNQFIYYGKKIQQICNQEENGSKEKFYEYLKQIEDLITLWEDISKTCCKIQQIFHLPFVKNVVLPLLVGSLSLNTEPLFTIKYSMLILKKLLRIIANFNILDVLIRLIFVEEQVFYWPSQMYKSKIAAFDILRIMDKKIEEAEVQQKADFGPAIKKFYDGVLKSKDNHFLLMINSFLCKLISIIKQDTSLLEQHGLQCRGKLNMEICSKLISQLIESHRLITIESILNTLIVLNDEKPLPHHLEQQFILIFRKIFDEMKVHLKSKSQLWDLIIEINQYQIQKMNTIQFGQQEGSKKIQQIYRLVFLWDIKSEEANTLPFYSCIPDTVEDHFRYIYDKFLMLRKANSYLSDGPEQKNLMTEYYSKFVANFQLAPGSILPLNQVKGQLYECQIIDEKFLIPALWLVDENFFIIGHWDKPKNELKIILAIKYKHISSEIVTKKQKMFLCLGIRAYDYKYEKLVYKDSISIKRLEAMMPRIAAYQVRSRQKQTDFIFSCIKKTQQILPKPSLI